MASLRASETKRPTTTAAATRPEATKSAKKTCLVAANQAPRHLWTKTATTKGGSRTCRARVKHRHRHRSQIRQACPSLFCARASRRSASQLLKLPRRHHDYYKRLPLILQCHCLVCRPCRHRSPRFHHPYWPPPLHSPPPSPPPHSRRRRRRYFRGKQVLLRATSGATPPPPTSF